MRMDYSILFMLPKNRGQVWSDSQLQCLYKLNSKTQLKLGLLFKLGGVLKIDAQASYDVCGLPSTFLIS